MTDYTGFNNPQSQYYGTDPDLPVLYTGAFQKRQFGVGGATTLGQAPSIIPALVSAPAAMTTAANSSATNAAEQYVVTTNDIQNYHADA